MATVNRLHGLIAVVTGSSSGIGRATALEFAHQGAELVVCVDLHSEAPREVGVEDNSPTHSLIASRNGDDHALFLVCDVRVEKREQPYSSDAPLGVMEMVQHAVQKAGRIDVLVNCAGIGVFGALHETSLESWCNTMTTNTTGTFLGMKHVIAQFLRQDPRADGSRGSIVNIASIGASVGIRGGGAYCASKAAIVGLTRSAAVDYARSGIRCNALLPGYVQTRLLQPHLDNEPGLADYINTLTPAGRLAQPREIAGAAVWLTSGAESGFVTGVALPVDGGFTAV